jgi:hypothetical protein
MTGFQKAAEGVQLQKRSAHGLTPVEKRAAGQEQNRYRTYLIGA